MKQYTDGGDLGRIKRQQDFVKELVKQLKSPENSLAIAKFINSIYRNVDTNISLKDILRGLQLMNRIELDNIKAEVVPGESHYQDHLSYYIIDEDKLQEIIDTEYYEYKNNDVQLKINKQ